MYTVTINPDDPSPQLYCPQCSRLITPTLLSKPIPISEWDKNNNTVRTHAFLCCGSSWLVDPHSDAISAQPGGILDE